MNRSGHMHSIKVDVSKIYYIWKGGTVFDDNINLSGIDCSFFRHKIAIIIWVDGYFFPVWLDRWDIYTDIELMIEGHCGTQVFILSSIFAAEVWFWEEGVRTVCLSILTPRLILMLDQVTLLVFPVSRHDFSIGTDSTEVSSSIKGAAYLGCKAIVFIPSTSHYEVRHT